MSWLNEITGKFVRPILHAAAKLTPASEIDEDPDECVVGDDLQVVPVTGLAVIIHYADAKAKLSERLVTCRRYDLRNEVGYITAFCHVRQSVRAFRIDRVREVFDPTTGESLGNAAEFFGQFSADQIHKSSYGWGLSVSRRTDLTALLTLIVFAARCDREYHPLERATLERAITRFWLHLELDGEPDCDSITSYADRLAPDGEAFWVSLHRLKGDPVLKRQIAPAVREVIEADGMLSGEELYWGSKIEEFLTSDA